MSKFVFTNVRLFAGGADLSGVGNKISLDTQREDKPATNWLSGGWTEVLGGLASTTFDGEGQWEAGDPSKVDDQSWSTLGGTDTITACPSGASVGDVAWLSKYVRTSYHLGGAVGDVAPWAIKAAGSWPLVRGQVMHPPGAARTANGAGTAVQFGAVPAGKQLYASLHVLSLAGTATPSVTVTIETDNAQAFLSPATALTFAQATALGGQVARGAGVGTDDWYRASWSVAGGTPSVMFAVALGIA